MEPVSERRRSLRLPCDANVESPQAPQEKPGIERARHAAGVRPIGPEVEPLVVRPHGESTDQGVGMSRKVLGPTMHDDVCAMFERILQRRRSERRVDGEHASRNRVNLLRICYEATMSYSRRGRYSATGQLTSLDGITLARRVQRRLQPAEHFASICREVVVDEDLCLYHDANRMLRAGGQSILIDLWAHSRFVKIPRSEEHFESAVTTVVARTVPRADCDDIWIHVQEQRVERVEPGGIYERRVPDDPFENFFGTSQGRLTLSVL